jgi:hypothetical protein
MIEAIYNIVIENQHNYNIIDEEDEEDEDEA